MRLAAIFLSLFAFAIAGFVGRSYLGPALPPLPAPSILHVERAILQYVAEKHPTAPLADILAWPRVLLEEARDLGWDHCLLLAQAEIESGFRTDRKGKHGEIGIFQILPSTAKQLGVLEGLEGVLLNTQTATRYLRDIQTRKTGLRDILAEYNGPKGAPHYYRLVVGAYVEILERESLRCRYTRREPLITLLHDDTKARRTTP